MMENFTCPVCGESGREANCVCCGFEIVRHYVGVSENAVWVTEQARIEAARNEWVARNVPRSDGWINYRHELKYKVEVKRSVFGQDEPKLLLHITTPVSPPLQLPATVLVGREERLPTSPNDGVELCRWPITKVGPEGGLFTAPLTIPQGKAWFVRLFMDKEPDAARIRLIHGSAKEMRIA